ncbi:MAG: ArsR family transcriptional regulator [Candidatus Odinarchaeota archaeon]
MTTYDELTHQTHINILKTIVLQPRSLTDIATLLRTSRPEISRHLARLRELTLVEKDDNLNRITALGELILEILSPLDFIIQHYGFFKDHPFINFPSEFLHGINRLQDSQLIVGTGHIFQKAIEVARTSHVKLKLMVNTPMPNIAGVFYEEGQLIIPMEAPSSILTHENLSKDLKSYEIRKFSDEINYSIGIIDHRCGFIHFPDKNGLPDMNACFFVDSDDGMDYLLSLWDYYWEKSSVFLRYP